MNLLLRVQCGQGDLSAATAHFNGLKTLLSLLGFDIRLPFTLLMSMQAYAALTSDFETCAEYLLTSSIDQCSALFGEEPYVVVPSHLRHSSVYDLLGDDRLTPGLDRLTVVAGYRPCALLLHPNNDFIGPVLSDVTKNLHMVDSYRELMQRGEVHPSYEQVQALFVATLLQQHRLQLHLSLNFRDKSIAHAQEAIRLCMVLKHGPPVNISLPRTPYRISFAHQLQTTLTKSLTSDTWKSCPELWLWVLTSAACVCDDGDQWHWLLDRLASVCMMLHVDSLDVLCARLVRFGFAPEHYANLLRKVWSDVEMRRPPTHLPLFTELPTPSE